ncbi:MAG: hypothetical protein V4654_03675 [Bdellovibrionota bacterium]
MKLKTVYSTIALIFLVVGIALWKLNETYRAEKVSVKQNQLQTQLTALRSSLVSQISQLRNTLSTYTVQIDEAKINWVQLKPFYALAVVQEDASNRLAVNKLFLQSGSVADRWNSSLLQQNLQAKVTGNQLLRVQTFKDATGLTHLAMIVFDREKRNNQPRSGVMVVGDVSYFQRFFDLQRTSSITQVLLTADKTVAAHTEYEYVGNLSEENKVSESSFFIDRQELRGTNLNLLSYTSKKAQSNFDVPLSMLGIILGLGFLMSGILLFVAKPDAPQTAQAPAAAARPTRARPIAEEESVGVGLATQASTPQPTARQTNLKPTAPPSTIIPLDFDHEEQIVPIQVQACVQQAIFNVDRQLKSQSVVIKKEFVSAETVLIDYPKFIKIFENVLLNVSSQLPNNKKRIQLRSYDSEGLTVLEIQAPIKTLNLHAAIVPALMQASAEFSQVASSAGESIFRFSFTRPEVSEQVVKHSTAKNAAAVEMRFELNESEESEFKMPEMTPVNPVQNDLDIDALLSLDDDEPQQGTSAKINIEKEMQPTKFKLDEKMSIVEDPEINVAATTQESKADQNKVKIRRPEKG